MPLPSSLRSYHLFGAIRRALGRSSTAAFRVLQFSVQRDHLHILVEADSPSARTRGTQGLAIRVAKTVNRVLGRRGAVWGDRHHGRILSSPRAVRHALVYVLQNFRKRGHPGTGMDPCSSARWFSGWTVALHRPATSAPVVTPRTWLALWGWRRHGLLAPDEAPAAARRRG